MGAAFWPVVVVGALFVWIVYVAVDLEVPAFLAKWYREPGNSVRALTLVGSLFIVLITLVSPADSLLGNLRTDAITVAATVIVIEELGRYRAGLEEKERIIRQMSSLSHDFALDAARIIVDEGWHKDGSVRERQFTYACLRGVHLPRAELAKAHFDGADLQGSDLSCSKLVGATFVNTNLQGADLSQCTLVNSNLMMANLQEADLSYTNLQFASLNLADMRRSNLRSADMQLAQMENVKLENASLVYADLRGANLRGADLRGADLMEANLRGAFLNDANLQGAKCNSDTIWPITFNPKSAGVRMFVSVSGFIVEEE